MQFRSRTLAHEAHSERAEPLLSTEKNRLFYLVMTLDTWKQFSVGVGVAWRSTACALSVRTVPFSSFPNGFRSSAASAQRVVLTERLVPTETAFAFHEA